VNIQNEVKSTSESKAKSESTNQSRKVEISGNAQVNASGAGAFGLGDIYGTVANTINELPSSSNPNEPGLKELLTELKKAGWFKLGLHRNRDC